MLQHRRPEFSSIWAVLERDSQNRDRLRSQRPTHLSSVSKSSVLAARSPAVTASQTLRSSKSVKTTPNADQKQVGLWSAFPPPKLGWATLKAYPTPFHGASQKRVLRTVLRTSVGPLCLWHSASAALLAKRCRGARAERALCKHSYPAQ